MKLQKTSLIHNQSSYPYYYLGHYHPFDAGSDPLSISLLKFKRGIQPDLGAWIDHSVLAFRDMPPDKNTVILRALHHDETIPASSPLDLLGQALANTFGCRYQPSLLHKTRPVHGNKSNKTLSLDERQTSLQNIYSFTPQAPDIPFLIIDDLLTSGATIRAIIDALPPNPLQIFTLARTVNDAYPMSPQKPPYPMTPQEPTIIPPEPPTQPPQDHRPPPPDINANSI